MNIKSLTLTILSLTAATVAVCQPTLAQQNQAPEGAQLNARWSYPPNIYRIEQPRLPADYGAPSTPHNVRAGAPRMSLVDPTMLAKAPAAPAIFAPLPAVVVRPTVSARPIMTSATPRLIPSIPAAFKAAFGSPITPPVVASLPIGAQAQPQTARPSTPAKATVAHAPTRSYNNSLSGRMLPRKHASGQSASALPAISGYGQNVGYTPGSFTLKAGSGSSSSANVSGVILQKRK